MTISLTYNNHSQLLHVCSQKYFDPCNALLAKCQVNHLYTNRFLPTINCMYLDMSCYNLRIKYCIILSEDVFLHCKKV